MHFFNLGSLGMELQGVVRSSEIDSPCPAPPVMNGNGALLLTLVDANAID